MIIALASELDRLTSDQRARVTHLIIDDGDWSEEQIATAVANLQGIGPMPALDLSDPDPTRYDGELL